MWDMKLEMLEKYMSKHFLIANENFLFPFYDLTKKKK